MSIDGNNLANEGIERHKKAYRAFYNNLNEENFIIDVCEPEGYLYHAWEECINSGASDLYITPEKNKANQILQHLKDVHDNLGFKRVYFDKIIAGEPYIVTYKEDIAGNSLYDWKQVDTVYDKILAIGMKPFVTMSAIPKALASDPENTNYDGANSSAPKDYIKWRKFCEEFVKHLNKKYGEDEVNSWYIQIMNEGDMRDLYWSGSSEEWFKTYDYAATGIRKASSKIKLGPGGFCSAHWPMIAAFLDHITSFNYDPEGNPKGSPMDYINSHSYPLDFSMRTDFSIKNDFEKLERYMESRFGPGNNKEIIISEWNIIGDIEPRHIFDGTMSAAFIAKQTIECSNRFFSDPGKKKFFSYWCHSDVFNELGEIEGEFPGLFGLLTPNGIRKPSYNAFKMLKNLGTSRIKVSGGNEEVNGIATYNNDRIIIVLYNCKYDILRVDGDERLKRLVNLKIQNVPWSKILIKHYRIDNNHSNAYEVWKDMGSPVICSKEQIKYLKSKMNLELLLEPSETNTYDGIYRTQFELPMPSVSMIEIIPLEKEFVRINNKR